MPGNELEDRVHNFFAQDKSLHGQHHSQAVEGSWPVLDNNFWVGSQRQVDLVNSNNLNFNPENSGIDRGDGSYPLHVSHGLSFTQSNSRPDFAKSQSLNEQPNLNGFMYENQFRQTRHDKANFLGVDRDSDQRHFITSKGLSIGELQQQVAPDHQIKASLRSGSPLSFDLFGGLQQMNHQQSSIPQPLQRQQSGINNMQQLQQQLMIRKMQELQRQQQLQQQLDLRQQNLINQVTSFAEQTSGSQSTVVNGTPNSDTLQYPWAAEHSTNWLNRGSPTMQGSPSGHGFPPNSVQTQRLVDMVPQQGDQSLYGVPISRGLPVNQYSQVVTGRSAMPQMSISSNYLQHNQHNLLPGVVSMQSESSTSRHKFQNEYMFGPSSGQSINTGVSNMGGLQQVNSMSRNAVQQDFLGRQELAVRPETSLGKPIRQVASPQNEVALDPTEEKILFGSDENIWSAFGKETHMNGEAGNSFDNVGLSNGLASIQSGSWSALMQSAVAETSNSDIVQQEEWSGMVFRNNDGPSGSQPPSTHIDSCKQENTRISSALNSESFPLSDDIRTANVTGLNRMGQKFQNEPDQTLQTGMSGRLFQSFEESGKRPTSGSLQHLVAEQNQIYGDSSRYPLQADTSAKTNSPTWMSGQALQSNGWTRAAIPPGGDRVTIPDEAEKLQQNSQNRVVPGEVVHVSSLWKPDSVPSSVVELGRVKSRVNDHQENQCISSSKDASVAKSYDEISSPTQKNYLLNQWKNVHPPSRSQDGGNLGRPLNQATDHKHVLHSMKNHEKGEVSRNEMENFDGKEASSDSHRSNLSQHNSGVFIEGGLSDVSDSQSLPSGKQKSGNQLSRKVSAPRKFQYHPMGNVDEDAEPTYGVKQPARVQAISQQNAHFGQSKIFGHVPRNSTVTQKGQSSELRQDTKGTDEEPSHGNLSGHAPNSYLPFSRADDTYTSKNASSSSQNMLELLHKVDQSRDHGARIQFSSSECDSPSQLPEAENFDGFGQLHCSQSSVSHGFGLQLGPPSQKLRITDHPSSSQNGKGSSYSMGYNTAAAGVGDKGHQMVASHSVQSLPSTEETQIESKLSRSATLGHGGNESFLYRIPGNFTSAFHSGSPHSSENVQNQQGTRVSERMSMKQHIDSLNKSASYPAQRSVETLLPDASGSFQQDNLASSGGMYQQSGHNDVQERVPTASITTNNHERTSQQFAMHSIGRRGNFVQMSHNMWSNTGVQFPQVLSHIPESAQPNIVESSSAPLIQGYVHGIVDEEEQRLKESCAQPVASVNTNPVQKMKTALGKAHFSDESLAISASTQKDIEAFGRSLKPNSNSDQNYSLQNQMEALKDGETDSSSRVSTRVRGPYDIAGAQQAALKTGQQNGNNAVVGDSLGTSSGVPSEDSNLGCFRTPDILQRKASHQGNAASHDGLGLSRDVPQSFSCSDYATSIRVDHPQVSPQMAPSWFSQYGTFKNGQMLQIYDSHKVTPIRPGEPPFSLGKASSGLDTLNPEGKGTVVPIDACPINNSHQTSSSVAGGHFTSPSSQLNVTGQHMAIHGLKKRKSTALELHPWHKEISEGSPDFWALSMAEAEWNKAANRLPEKVEDDAERSEGPPVLRSKRRLISTTHVMQQLIRPAQADILAADASTSYEIVAYTVSRLALGVACSMASHLSNLDIPCNGMDLLFASRKSSKRTGHCYEKATEELMGRAKKLENDFLRLERSASMVDLRVECQDLEKFSMINRFARFHGRGQTDNAETASTEVNANTQKPIPQRYVTALPMPGSLPDRVQCLSL